MGCVDSTVHTPSLFTSMKPVQKEVVRDIIGRDDIAALAQFDSAENCAWNAELSQSGVRWSPLHFCCRFDSPACLDYFLKKCFLQAPTLYPFFVNQQTAEGLSCLHLCGIWSAYRCAVLLLRYGAINLALRDKRQKTAQAVMGEYGLGEVERLLGQFKSKEGWITGWNLTLLQQLPNLPSLHSVNFYKEEMSRMEDMLRSRLTDTAQSGQLSADELRLREQKGRLQLQREQLHQQLMQVQRQAAKDGKKRKNEEGAPALKEQSPQMIALEKQLKEKEEEIERFKYSIGKLNSEKIDELLQLQVNKLDFQKPQIADSFRQLHQHFHLFQQDILSNRNQIPNGEVRPELSVFLREPQRKSKFSESSSKWAEAGSIRRSKLEEIQQLKKENVDKNTFNRLPLHVQQRYRKAKQQGFFQDEEFPHNEASLGGLEHESKVKPFLSSLTWLRPSEFISADFQLFDGIDPNDIKQGQLGVCYCLATISQYARSPKKIVEMFSYADLELGFYVVKFFTNGKPNHVVVDDYFPCSAASKQPLFSKPIGNQIWVLLIEKAWAKLIGSYFAAQLMTPDLFMEDLTGSPTYGAWFKDKPDKMRDILTYSPKNYLIVLTTGSRRIQGIVNNHAYSLLKVIPHNNTHLYKLRNPWGRFQWNGTYGQQSALWTPELKAKCEQVDGDDGTFFLSQSEVLQAFDYYSIGLDETAGKYSYLEFTSAADEPLYFRFVLSKPSMMAIRVTQPFKRIVREKDYRYSPVVLEVGKITQNGKVTFLSQGSDKCYFGQKSVYANNDIYRQYEKGEYFIRVKMQWLIPNKYNSAVLSVYCDQQISLQRMDEEQGVALWNKMLLSYLEGKRLKELNQDITYSMEWMRAQMLCYAVLRDTSKHEILRVRWTFNPNELQNCYLANNKASDTTIQFTLSRTLPFGLGTLNRKEIGKSCKSGNVVIHSFKP